MQSHGIVLHSLRYGDQQIILDIFTEVAGTVSFIVRLPRGGKRGARASVWQPLSLVEVLWEPRPKADLQKPQELALWQPWRDIPFQPAKAAMGLFLSEFLSHALRSEQENGPLFDFLTSSLHWLDEADRRFANFHVVFLLHLSRFLGFMPNADDWEPGAFFDLQAASFTLSRPLHPFYIDAEESSLVSKFLRMDYRSMRAVGLNGAARRRTLQLIILFYRLHIPEFPEVRSLEVLADVFS
jgi:DNA repair protein RecO (recombination protein O)